MDRPYKISKEIEKGWYIACEYSNGYYLLKKIENDISR